MVFRLLFWLNVCFVVGGCICLVVTQDYPLTNIAINLLAALVTRGDA